MCKFSVILSSGIGPLHFGPAARSLSYKVFKLTFICGYVPKRTDSFMLHLLAFLRGKSVSAAIKKRQISGDRCVIVSCVFAEFVNQLALVFDRIFHGFYRCVESGIWSIYGWQSKQYMRDADIFHVRSGAGQGGAIDLARKKGMRILVDQSALHPAKSASSLQDDYDRWGVPIAISPQTGVWRNVLRDCNAADIIVVNANHIKDSFVEQGYDPSRLRVVYLGIREDFMGLKQRYSCGHCFRVLFTGAFVLLKGAEYVLKSLEMLVQRNVSVHYDIVGAVGLPKHMLEMYAELPVSFHGQIPQDDLKAYLERADCYLFPSLADGCAQSGMEALSAGLPVVATYQSGLPITDGETGCIVPMKDAKAIADKIEWLIANPMERQRIGQNAVKMMRDNYTWSKYAENMKKVYEEMLENG